MPMPAFLSVAGPSGAIKGSARQKTREGKITVIGINHEIMSVPDAKTGAPTDAKKHGYLVITKDIDVSSPALHVAHAGNVVLNKWELECFRMPPTGGMEENHYTIKLTGAKIAFIRTVMPNAKKPEFQTIPEYEEVGFTYEEINWSWKAKDETSSGSDKASDFVGGVLDYIDEKAEAWAKTIGESVSSSMKDAAKNAVNPPEAPKPPAP